MSLRKLFTGAAKPPKNPSLKKPAEKDPPAALPLPLEEGLDHLRAGRFDHAIVALRLALQREPGRFAAVRGLVTAYVQTDELKPARRVMERFTSDHPMAVEGWRLASQLEWKLGDRARAIELLYAGLKRLPHSQLLHRQLAVFLAAEGKLADAAAHVGELSRDETRGVMADYLAAASGDCTNKDAVLRCAKPQAGEADQDWVDQIVTDPALLSAILTPLIPQDALLSAENREMLLRIEWKLGQLLEAQPNHSDRQLLLARVQARLDMIPAAILSLQHCALRSNPDLIEAHRLRAALHARIGEGEQAVAILRQLLKRGVSWPDIHFEIAAIEQQSGRSAEARSHLYSAIRLNPQFYQAREMLERLRSVKKVAAISVVISQHKTKCRSTHY